MTDEARNFLFQMADETRNFLFQIEDEARNFLSDMELFFFALREVVKHCAKDP